MNSSWVNGQPGDTLRISDRGLQYGDGLFETITCLAGHPRWLPRHMARLRRGCERLQLGFGGWESLEQEIRLAAAGAQRCIVKVLLTRGLAQRRGYRPAGTESPTRILTRHEWPAADPGAEAGFQVALSSVRLGCNPTLAGIKHLNRLEQVLAQQAIGSAAIDEVLMLDSRGDLISGSMSNVFFVDGEGLSTPSLEQCGVAGITRERICEAAARAGCPVRLRSVRQEEFAGIQEAFLTNVRWGVQPIGSLEGRALTRREWAVRVRGWLNASPD